MAKTDAAKTKPQNNQPNPGMAVLARLRYLRMSPRKTRSLANFITGMDVSEAQEQLKFMLKAPKRPIAKLLDSAVANATNNFNLEKSNLYIKKFIVNQGPTLKRWKPKAHGRAGMIRRRTCHLELTLGERVPSQRVARAKAAPETEIKTVDLDSAKGSSKLELGSGGDKSARGRSAKGFTKKLFSRKTG